MNDILYRKCEPIDDSQYCQLYKYQNRMNIRYYTEGKYIDHGRIIYSSFPEIGDIVHPFHTKNGQVNWKVLDIKIPENDSCIEIYFENMDKK